MPMVSILLHRVDQKPKKLEVVDHQRVIKHMDGN